MFEQAPSRFRTRRLRRVKKAIDEALRLYRCVLLRRIEGAQAARSPVRSRPGYGFLGAQAQKVMPPFGDADRGRFASSTCASGARRPRNPQKFSGSTRATKGRNRLWLLRISKSSRAGCLHGPMSGCGRGDATQSELLSFPMPIGTALAFVT